MFQLYRDPTGNLDQGLGDTMHVGDVHVTHICFINGFQGSGASADMRFFQSSGPLTISPGWHGIGRGGVHLRSPRQDGDLSRSRRMQHPQ